MQTESSPAKLPAWPCTVEDDGGFPCVRDGCDRRVPLPRFQDDCKARAVRLQREARDAALRACGTWLHQQLARMMHGMRARALPTRARSRLTRAA